MWELKNVSAVRVESMAMAGGTTEEFETESGLLIGRKERESWVIKIVREEDAPQTELKPRLGVVPWAMKYANEINRRFLLPEVVSLGLYGKSRTIANRLNGPFAMDCHKEDAVRWFVSLFDDDLCANSEEDKAKKIYDDFAIKASLVHPPLRDWYVDRQATEPFNDEDVLYMMFLDGCFILHFVYLHVKPDSTSRNPYLDRIPVIVRDLFLLENQIPYPVLRSLMDLMPDPKPLEKQDIENFIQRLVLPEYGSLNNSTSNSDDDREPLHLLDFLRTKLIGGPVDMSSICDASFFGSIMELKAAGIRLRRCDSCNLNKIEFHQGLIHGYLSLPRMIIDDMTKSRLLNLIAYETCRNCPPNSLRAITSYICFLGSLIHQADDVKELRSKGILLNTLGNDDEVVKLFQELRINLVRDRRIYADALIGIQSHCTSRLKVRWGEMLTTYFSSPWTVISVLAAILLLFLTVVQTIFTVWS